MIHRILLTLCPLACLTLLGCGGKWGTVSGTVTLNGENLKEGTICFHPVSGGATAYGSVTNGAFSISTGKDDGLAVGHYKVTVAASSVPEQGTGEKSVLFTPPRYATPKTSDLEAEVKSGANSFTFTMTGTVPR